MRVGDKNEKCRSRSLRFETQRLASSFDVVLREVSLGRVPWERRYQFAVVGCRSVSALI